IDAGAFTGDTSLPLSKRTTKNVYAFEPFKDSFEILKKNISNNNIENIIPVNKSLGNINGERSLFLSGDNVQGITSDATLRNYDNEIKVQETTIDTFVEENNLEVGFITIDIEGAEMDLLEGAINTIKTQKPLLYISMYHKVSDYFDIIPWVANLDLGYEFNITKENPWTFLADTVVQCRMKY
ncbi:FkbM family methyltransferase, partial [Methanobrevibacter sp.]|uniref:FkbM family methyltransferase n=1 Tax=Methanobrevibacter sp. TaxID=66852 RepID=UPI003977145F